VPERQSEHISAGFTRRRARSQELLREKDIDERRLFCYQYRDFTHWDHAIFSDEAGFWLGDKGPNRCWFSKDSLDNFNQEPHTTKINVWASISALGENGHTYL
jgi:hypothetical protein